MMKLFAQHGAQLGEKIDGGIESKLVDGIIFSPRDIALDRLKSKTKEFLEKNSSLELLFDPQYYASFLANKSEARLGKLLDDYSAYFGFQRRSDLERETFVEKELEKSLNFQNSLNVTSIVAPNIFVPRSFNSIEGVIAKHFIRLSGRMASKYSKPILATVAISRNALLEKEEMEPFLEEITSLEDPPAGFYLLVGGQNSEARLDIFNADVIAGWMLFNYALGVNHFKVVNGYSDILTPFLGAVGGYAGATGWWSNLRLFSLDRFHPTSGGGRLPNQRYLSIKLLNRLAYFEIDRLRNAVPEIINGLPTDTYYSIENGSEPERTKEPLQSWDALRQLNKELTSGAIEENLKQCLGHITKAIGLYGTIEATQPIPPLEEKSNGSHIEELKDAIELFCQKAQVKVSS